MKKTTFAIAALLLSATLSAQNMTASASSEYGENYSADKAFDHDLTTRWAAETGGEQQITALFELERKVSKIKMVEKFDRIVRFKIEYKNNQKWVLALQGTQIGEKYSYTFPKPLQTKELRITILETDQNKGANLIEVSFE